MGYKAVEGAKFLAKDISGALDLADDKIYRSRIRTKKHVMGAGNRRNWG